MQKTWGRFFVAAVTLFLAPAAFAQDACPVTDINGDGVTDESDVIVLRDALGTYEGDAGYVPAADLNGDGRVTTQDYGVLLDCS
ncbi:MAG: dockerin type I domain-containing protein [bacterium]|nr:dockerin type I domain-containing protein [bacterium]